MNSLQVLVENQINTILTVGKEMTVIINLFWYVVNCIMHLYVLIFIVIINAIFIYLYFGVVWSHPGTNKDLPDARTMRYVIDQLVASYVHPGVLSSLSYFTVLVSSQIPSLFRLFVCGMISLLPSDKMKLPDPKQVLSSLFPIVRWSKSYDAGAAVGDLIAGITVALTLIPQSIAYASLAGFEPQYGLYASFAGGFVYGVMGTCPQINIGPTALLSLLTFTYTNGTSPDFAVLLCLTSGIVQLIAGTMQLGFLVEFVSLPVVSGFTSAAAVTIASSQIKGLLGLKFSAETFIATWKELFRHIGDTRLPDTLLSLACCIVLLGMKALKDIRIKDKEEKHQKGIFIMQKSLWFAGVSRNAVVVVLAAVIAFFVYLDVGDPLILTGKITPGLPMPQAPPFHTIVGNETISAGGMLAHLGSGLLVVPLVGIISNVAIAKAFSNGKTLDATQEIIALGACNVAGAFFRSFPVNGSFTRSAVSDASGVRSPAAGFYTGIIVLLTLALLTPYFYFIPRAALSAVIVCAVLNMVDVAIIKKLWKSNRLDIIPLLGTFVCCLALGIEIGLICGVGVDVLLLLYYNSRPPLDVKYTETESLPPHYSIHPVGSLHFAGAERVRSKLSALKQMKATTLEELTIVPGANDRVLNHGASNGSCNGGASNMARTGLPNPRTNVLVIHCDSLYRLDYTFLQSIKMLVAEWTRSGRVVWCDARPLVKEQLNAVISDPVFCDTHQLPMVLSGAMAQDGTRLPHYDLNQAKPLFEQFMKDYKRQYKNAVEKEKHFIAFKMSLYSINKLNEMSKGDTYFGINNNSDYTTNELKSKLGLKRS